MSIAEAAGDPEHRRMLEMKRGGAPAGASVAMADLGFTPTAQVQVRRPGCMRLCSLALSLSHARSLASSHTLALSRSLARSLPLSHSRTLALSLLLASPAFLSRGVWRLRARALATS